MATISQSAQESYDAGRSLDAKLRLTAETAPHFLSGVKDYFNMFPGINPRITVDQLVDPTQPLFAEGFVDLAQYFLPTTLNPAEAQLIEELFFDHLDYLQKNSPTELISYARGARAMTQSYISATTKDYGDMLRLAIKNQVNVDTDMQRFDNLLARLGMWEQTFTDMINNPHGTLEIWRSTEEEVTKLRRIKERYENGDIS